MKILRKTVNIFTIFVFLFLQFAIQEIPDKLKARGMELQIGMKLKNYRAIFGSLKDKLRVYQKV